jgi:hypothetical protein
MDPIPLADGAPRTWRSRGLSHMKPLTGNGMRFAPLSKLDREAEQADDSDWITLNPLQLHCPASHWSNPRVSA